MKAKTAALLGMAAMALGATTPVNATAPTQESQTQRVREQKEPEKQITTVRKQNVFSGFAPGYEFIAPGIPPKIYGMYHVRRGTHKNTNK